MANNRCADLHMHSVYSDGVLTVKELINEARKNDVDIISITDHDCFDGVIEAKKIETDIQIIYGIEVSSYLNDESIHVLGYFNTLEGTEELQNMLKQQVEKRVTRALEIKRLLEENFNIVLDEDKLLNCNSITRGHIARCIIESGYPYTKEDIFKHMIGDGCKAYIPSTKISTRQVIKALKKANALVILAHPVLIKKSNVEDILDMGVDGLEAIYPLNKESDTKRFVGLAKKRNLIITAGSDFHSFNDRKHGNIGSVRLTGDDLNKFLKRLG